MRKKIVFYAFADSIKAKIVFNQIKLNQSFDKYDKILITDKKLNKFNIKFKKIINYSDLNKINNILKKNVFLIISLGWDKKIQDSLIKKNKFKIINCHSGILPIIRDLLYLGIVGLIMKKNLEYQFILLTKKLIVKYNFY